MRNIAVIGLGTFGSAVARELATCGAQVLALDKHAERVEAVKDAVSYAATLDATNPGALQSVSIQDMDVAVVCIGEDVEASLLVTLLLRKSGVPHIWARAINPLQSEILRMLDVDNVIRLEIEMGRTVARSLVSSSISFQYSTAPGHSIAEVKIPATFLGKTLREIEPGTKYKVRVVAVKTFEPAVSETGERLLEEKLDENYSDIVRLQDDMSLLIAGRDHDIERFTRGAP